MDELIREAVHAQVPGWMFVGACLGILGMGMFFVWLLKQFMTGEMVPRSQLEDAQRTTEIWMKVALESRETASKGVEVARQLLPMGHAANNILGTLQSFTVEQQHGGSDASSPPQGG